MACHINLVQNDTGPAIVVQLTDDSTGLPVDLSAGGTSGILQFRMSGTTTLKDTLTGVKLPYFQRDDGSFDTTYAANGSGGRMSFSWSSTSLNGTPGGYEGQVQITFAGGVVQTVYDIIKFTLRADF